LQDHADDGAAPHLGGVMIYALVLKSHLQLIDGTWTSVAPTSLRQDPVLPKSVIPRTYSPLAVTFSLLKSSAANLLHCDTSLIPAVRIILDHLGPDLEDRRISSILSAAV
jgi:hypothetical protein